MSITKEILIPPGHSKPVGRYSPGVSAALPSGARMLFVSGQVATDKNGAVMASGDAQGQTEVVFQRMAQVLASAGGTLMDLVSVQIFLVDIARDFPAVSAVRDRVFGEFPPASTLVQVAGLVEPGVLVEINGVALLGQDPKHP